MPPQVPPVKFTTPKILKRWPCGGCWGQMVATQLAESAFPEAAGVVQRAPVFNDLGNCGIRRWRGMEVAGGMKKVPLVGGFRAVAGSVVGGLVK